MFIRNNVKTDGSKTSTALREQLLTYNFISFKAKKLTAYSHYKNIKEKIFTMKGL